MAAKAFGFFTNPNNKKALDTARAAIALARSMGYSCYTNSASHDALNIDIKLIGSEKIEYLIAIGGDGTILRAAALAAQLNIPILGVNLGRVGFLSEIDPDRLREAYLRLDTGAYTLENKMMLDCSVNGAPSMTCLNETLLYKHSFSGVVDISITIDGIDAGSVFCDGLIISTPTGSTGYSISAGGPVIAPGLDAAIITPVCPHTLTFRPIIVSPDAKLEFAMKSPGNLSLDGIYTREISTDDCIKVQRSKSSVGFIRFGVRNAYALIRNKLS